MTTAPPARKFDPAFRSPSDPGTTKLVPDNRGVVFGSEEQVIRRIPRPFAIRRGLPGRRFARLPRITISRAWVWRIAAVLLGLGLPLMGCTVFRPESIRYHIIDYPSPTRDARATIPETLMVYRFFLADAADFSALVISESTGQERSERRHRWEENPADTVTGLIRRDLEKSGLFQRTVDQSSEVHYRYALEGTISKLQGMIRDGKAAAFIEADITLTDFEALPHRQRQVLSKRYAVEVPSPEATPEAIVAAMNTAVRDLSARLRNDIAAAFAASTRGGAQEPRSVLPR